VVARSDLPIGTLLAQVVHAAGESSPGRVPPSTHAVVLAVPDESGLLEAEARLLEAGIPHITIREPDAPWCGQAMTIGIFAEDRTRVRKLLARLPLFRGSP
jgi:hypothetical protein